MPMITIVTRNTTKTITCILQSRQLKHHVSILLPFCRATFKAIDLWHSVTSIEMPFVRHSIGLPWINVMGFLCLYCVGRFRGQTARFTDNVISEICKSDCYKILIISQQLCRLGNFCGRSWITTKHDSHGIRIATGKCYQIGTKAILKYSP